MSIKQLTILKAYKKACLYMGISEPEELDSEILECHLQHLSGYSDEVIDQAFLKVADSALNPKGLSTKLVSKQAEKIQSKKSCEAVTA